MKVRFTDRAVADLENLADYLTEKNPAAARAVKSAIERSLGQLESFPGLGTPQTVAGVRKLVVRRYPYLIYYVVDHAAVEVRILTIQHAARERDFSDA